MARRGRGRMLATVAFVAGALVVRLLHMVSTRLALAAVIVLDVLGWAFTLLRALAGVREYRGRRREGLARLDALQGGLAEQFHPRLAAVLVAQFRYAVVLGRWARGGNMSRPGARRYRYDRGASLPAWILLVVLVIDGGVVDACLFVRTGGVLPWAGAALLTYAVFLMLALLAAGAVHPHRRTEQTLVLRQGARLQVTVQLHNVSRVEPSRRTAAHACGWQKLSEGNFELPWSRATNTTIYLRPGSVVHVGAHALPAQVIHFYADQPREVVTELSAIIEELARPLRTTASTPSQGTLALA